MDEQNTQALLSQLNRFTRRTHTLDEVYLFDVILCDNDIDRDGDCFSEAALKQLAERFIGVTGIFDHNPKSGNQNARIFAAEVISDESRTTQAGLPYRAVKANAYMIRTDANRDLIREIDGGIKKEVSISCAVGKQICSVCGANRLKAPCVHLKGHEYGGKRCFCTLSDITAVYEWSFVAVPAQPRAGVTKTCGACAGDPEKEALRLRVAETEATLSLLTEQLRREVVRLCFRGGDNACAEALAETAAHLSGDELLHLRDRLAAGFPPPGVPKIHGGDDDRPYRIGGSHA